MSFADAGVAEMKVPGATETIFNGIALDGSNRIIAAGYWYVDQPHPIMARYLLDGSLDPGFASGGVLQQDSWNGYFTDVAIQPDGKILALANLSGVITPWRFTEDGWPDATFGVGGSATHTLPTSGVLLLVRRPDDGFGTDAFIVGGILRLGTGKATTFQWTLWRYFY
jgi:hypothetical protein